MPHTTYEVWLQPNRRAIWVGCILPLAIGVGGAALVCIGSGDISFWVGLVLLIFGAGVPVALLRWSLRPVVAYRDGCVLFNLRGGSPIAVPVEVVEAFFVGQGPAQLPGDAEGKERTATLVARLAQRHKEWAERDVKPVFGGWCDGYVTIRGTWCEPLTPEVVRRINRRLKDVKSLSETAPAHAATVS